jgi:hypothetical protein
MTEAARYRVKFYKDLLSPNGQAFRCLQKIIEIGHARSPERATKAALMRFQRLTNVRDWRLQADLIETECVDAEVGHRSAA